MTPVLLVMLALLAIGTGMILASLTAKYRDLQVLVGFGIQLWMYASPIVYPLSQIPGKWRILLSLNPVAYIVECFRYGWKRHCFHTESDDRAGDHPADFVCRNGDVQ